MAKNRVDSTLLVHMPKAAPTYDWRCRRCNCVNAAHTNVCTTCASYAQYQGPPSMWRQLAAAGVPAWRRFLIYVFGIVGAVLAIGGLALLTRVFFLTNALGMAWSAGAVAVGGALLWVAYMLHPKLAA